jgi:hypothetical protein
VGALGRGPELGAGRRACRGLELGAVGAMGTLGRGAAAVQASLGAAHLRLGSSRLRLGVLQQEASWSGTGSWSGDWIN